MNQPMMQSAVYYVLGTTVQFSLRATSETAATAAIAEAVARLYEIDDKMSYFKEDSEVAQINRAAGAVAGAAAATSATAAVAVSADTYKVIQTARHYSHLSHGALDPTIRPVVNEWGIFSTDAQVPSATRLNKALALVNYQYIQLQGASIGLARANQELDLGSIAKGFAADEVRDIFLKHHITSALLDLGGNISVIGNAPDGAAWKIGIRDPFGGSLEAFGGSLDDFTFGYVEVSDMSIVTSGGYEKQSTIGGVSYHHILDPRTGYPTDNELASVTMISQDAMDGDALATAAMVLGLEDGMNLINILEGMEAVFVTKDRKIYLTAGIVDHFRVTGADFTVRKESL